MKSNDIWRDLILIVIIAQSAGAVEYTDCFSAEGYDPPMSVLDMTLNNLMVRFWSAGALANTEYTFIAIAPRSTLARSGSIWLGQSMG